MHQLRYLGNCNKMKNKLRTYKIYILVLICRLIEKEKTFTLWKYRSKSHEHITYVFKEDCWCMYFYYKNRFSKRIEIISTLPSCQDLIIMRSALDYITFNYILLNHEKLGPENIKERLKTLKEMKNFIKEELNL